MTPKENFRAGFSIIELLIFSAIFTVIMIAFITMLVSVVRVGARQSAAAEVNQQSQFVLQQLQYYIERSSLVEIPQDQATTTLKLRMGASSEDPTIINLAGGVLYVDEGEGPAALTSSKVTVSNLSFIKRSNPPGKDSVQIYFTLEFNTPNITQQFVRSLDTAIARVSAANFDSNVVPSSTATYKLGVTGSIWSSVNDIINFSGANVGIGVTNPAHKLQVNGGSIYIDSNSYGLILVDSGGVCWTFKTNTAGSLTSTSSTCP